MRQRQLVGTTSPHTGRHVLMMCTYILGEYIVLYQTQRESLKKKFEQKDNFITQLIQDKETLQVYMHVIKIMRPADGDTIAFPRVCLFRCTWCPLLEEPLSIML